ncbi:hypothetical protein BKA66DRAFT_446386 [Pyrenochaeta sp. MPI-SDFR-AT-0127]|nr:hypothetical protein BKA66DRAFT_446386 [Pyrenochaeta sp. MPI-SDFR-AT-0127]
MPLNVLASYYNSEAYKRRIAKQEEKKAVSAPKLTRRKKALSLSDKNIRSAAQQLQSPFFKLPGELRTQIYEVFFGYRSGIHVVFWDGRLHSYRCQWTSDLAIPARHTQCWNNYCNGSWSQGSKQGWHDWKSDVMGLLRSCRIMHFESTIEFVKSLRHILCLSYMVGQYRQLSYLRYTETIPFLYSRPTFMFHDYASFLAFVASILPSRIQTIQSSLASMIWATTFITPVCMAPRPTLFCTPAIFQSVTQY